MKIEEEIYSRQKNLHITNAYSDVVIIGVGGVGSWIAFLIGLSGMVENLYLIDGDKVEVSNLNRTPYLFRQIGQYKVEAMQELILERRPFQKVIPINRNIDSSNQNDMNTLQDKGRIFDCRDIVDKLSEISPMIGGYDGDNISISTYYRHELVFDSGLNQRGYTTDSWLMPPLLIASLIVSKFYFGFNSGTRNYTTTLKKIVDNMLKEDK